VKKKILLIFVISLLFSLDNSSLAATLKSTVYELNNGNTDSTGNQGKFKIIKINPFQTLFCEIPVSFEAFHKVDKSIQFQLGFIFPIDEHSIGLLFESMGTNGTATNKGPFSYRTSPYNNSGLSFKIEFRKYRRSFYSAPQLMYKYCFYKETSFPVFSGNITRYQTESKFSNIFGFGFIIGRQSNNHNLVFDWYGGVGLRQRFMSVKIIKIENPAYNAGTVYPNRKENINSFYPFINIGLRIGIKL
jgi:hypothetical protein